MRGALRRNEKGRRKEERRTTAEFKVMQENNAIITSNWRNEILTIRFPVGAMTVLTK